MSTETKTNVIYDEVTLVSYDYGTDIPSSNEYADVTQS